MDEPAVDLRNYLYDLAAAERDKAAGDIVGYIMDQEELRMVIRLCRKDLPQRRQQNE